MYAGEGIYDALIEGTCTELWGANPSEDWTQRKENEGCCIDDTKGVCDSILESQLATARMHANAIFGTVNCGCASATIIDMMFAMSIQILNDNNWPELVEFIKDEEWNDAADAILDSNHCDFLGNRCQTASDQIRSCLSVTNAGGLDDMVVKSGSKIKKPGDA